MARAKVKDKLPKISVIIPSYNKVEYIWQTLQSIIDQKYPNIEIIVQDGGSTDGSVEIIKKYALKYPQIIKWVSKKDKGQVDAINKGLQKAKGDILTFINADDIYNIGRDGRGGLWKVSEFFQKNPDALWVTGFGDIINHKGDKISSFVTSYKNLFLKVNSYTLLLMVNYITQPATFIRRRTYLKYGPFGGTKNYVMEYDLWLKLGKIRMPGIIKESVASFRLTMDNISATSFNSLLSLDNEIAEKYTKNPFILAIHRLHNLGRIGLITLLKKYENRVVKS